MFVPQPLGEKCVESLQSFLRSKILPDNFYDYFTVSDSLYSILSKSKYYVIELDSKGNLRRKELFKLNQIMK